MMSLENRTKSVTRLVPPAPGELVSAAEYLYDIGELNNCLDLLHFFERPHKYPHLLTLWDDEQCRMGEEQDERRSIL